MSLITDLATFLRARAAITAVVGQRVYWLQAPQSPTYPLITYQQISGERVQPLSGTNHLARPVWQIDGWHTNPNAIDTLHDAILGLDGYVGAVGATTVRHFELLTSRQSIAGPLAAQGLGPCRVSFDFRIHHEETIP